MPRRRGTVPGVTSSAHVPRLLVAVETATGAAAVVGGVLLTLRPDGSLIAADPHALAGTPFASWRVPGLLLLGLVGGGYLGAAAATWWQLPFHRAIGVAAGLGLTAFELAELAWLGFQPLQAVFLAVGVGVTAGSARHRPTKATS